MLLICDEPEDKERWAAEFHAIWSEWMAFIFRNSLTKPDGTVVIPKEFVDHWTKRMNTSFVDLPEDAKGYPRENVERYLAVQEK